MNRAARSGRHGQEASCSQQSTLSKDDGAIRLQRLYAVFTLAPLIRPTHEALVAVFGGNLGPTLSRALNLWQYVAVLVGISVGIASLAYGISGYIRSRKSRVNSDRRRNQSPDGTFGFGALQLILATILFAILTASSMKMHGFGSREYLVIGSNVLVFFVFWTLRRNLLSALRSVSLYYIALCGLNSLVMLLTYPHGIYSVLQTDIENSNYYLLGLDNVCFIYSLIAIVLSLACSRVVPYSHRTLYASTVTVVIISYFYVSAGTGMAVSCALLLGLVLIRTSANRLLHPLLIGAMSGIMFFMIVLARRVAQLTTFLDLIGKDSTFTGRVYIWDAAFPCTTMFPTGWGIGPEMFEQCIGKNDWRAWISQLGHVHNVVLEYWLRGGTVGLIVFIAVLVVGLLGAWCGLRSRVTKLLLLGFVLLWLTLMFEGRMEIYVFWLIPALTAYATNFSSERAGGQHILAKHNDLCVEMG